MKGGGLNDLSFIKKGDLKSDLEKNQLTKGNSVSGGFPVEPKRDP